MHIRRSNQRWIKDVLPYIFILLMVLSIVFFQITHHFFINGTDSFFHMSVTYDTYCQIKSGNFSYFLSTFGFYHSLRIVNAVYGPLSGYFSGLLLVITGSWIRWEIATFLMIFTLAGVSMYQLCRYWHVTRVYSVLLGCLYMLSFPVTSLWMNSQYDGLGAVFMPWVLYFGSMIINHDSFKNWKLILLLVILAEIHVFSLLLGLTVLGLCFITSLIVNRDYKTLILKAIKILVITAILSFNVWGAILEVIGSNHGKVIPTYSISNMFDNVWSSIFYNRGVPLSQNVFLLGLSTSILITITVILYCLCAKHLNVQVNFIMVVLGLGYLWLSSRLFPWPMLQHHFPILNTDLQFPKRFLPVALSAFGLMLGILLTQLQHHLHNHVFIAIIFTIILGMFVIHTWQDNQYQAQYLDHEQTTASYYKSQLHRATGDMWMNNHEHPVKLLNSLRDRHPGQYFRILAKSTPDYMPTTQKITSDAQYHHLNGYDQYNQQIILNRLPYRYQLSHHIIKVSFNRQATKPITLPFVKYAHTQIMMNGKPLSKPQLSGVGAITVKPRRGRNVMTFKYVPSVWYRIIMWISILTWLLFMIDIFYRVKRNG